MVPEGGSEGAKAGGGPAGSDRAKSPPPKRKRVVSRPKVLMEHPDLTTAEFTIRRSFRIQDGIDRFLEENEGTAWANLSELYIRAANYCWHTGLLKRCPSSITAQRWIAQRTAVGERYRIREVPREGYWILERREG